MIILVDKWLHSLSLLNLNQPPLEIDYDVRSLHDFNASLANLSEIGSDDGGEGAAVDGGGEGGITGKVI